MVDGITLPRRGSTVTAGRSARAPLRKSTCESTIRLTGRCGQAFNGQLWGGISNAQYGTLTIGRTNSFQLDGIAAFDPMALSYALSLLGYSGTGVSTGRPATRTTRPAASRW